MRQFILRGTIPQAFFVRGHCRYYSRAASKFVEEATNPDNKTQIYISRTQNPFINLSIEHYLLQKTPADSTILFLYTNENSIVMGRNQNVWNEVNLHAVQHADEKISLVRRRSGGGTVFHDAGNVNYCVIFPTSKFDRDRHAEMIVRALHKLGVTTAMVNARHDIVLQKTRPNTPKTRKVSGSAYKVTRERSLHHGTCLLSSPNLRSITDYLRSPAKRFIKSRGVESVGSTISNAKVKSNKAFEDAVVKEFNEMYDKREPIILTEAVKEVPEIVKGIEELTVGNEHFSTKPELTNLEIVPRLDILTDSSIYIYYRRYKEG